MKKEYYEVVTELDESGFKEMPRKKIDHDLNVEQMMKNLLSLFKKVPSEEELSKMTEAEKREVPGCSITDYAWTSEVKEQFYDHPYHKKLWKKMNKTNSHTWFVLQCEPCDYTE
jgi:hypothetical protein